MSAPVTTATQPDRDPATLPAAATAQPATPIDVGTLQERLDEVVVIDVRSPGEFEGVHMPGARNLPLDVLGERVDEVRALVEGGQEVVLTCRTQNRSTRAQALLREAGLPSLPVLVGGIVAWEEQDAPVVRDVLRWDLERQVRLVAGSIVLLSIVASIWLPAARFVAGFVGAGLVFAAISNTCTMALLLQKLPYNRVRTT